MSDDKMRAKFEAIYSVPPMTQWSMWHQEYVPALNSMIDEARTYTSMFYAFCAGYKASRQNESEAAAVVLKGPSMEGLASIFVYEDHDIREDDLLYAEIKKGSSNDR